MYCVFTTKETDVLWHMLQLLICNNWYLWQYFNKKHFCYSKTFTRTNTMHKRIT